MLITATSRPQAKALYNEIHMRLKAAGELHRPVEADEVGWWALLDYGSVVVHVLQKEARDYYDLEHLYGACKELDWQAMDMPDLPEAPSRPAEV